MTAMPNSGPWVALALTVGLLCLVAVFAVVQAVAGDRVDEWIGRKK